MCDPCAAVAPAPRLLALNPCLPALTLLRVALLAVRAVMALVDSSLGHLGENLPFEAVCKCFEALVDPNSDRTKKPKMMQRLWENYGYREHPLFELMRLILPHLDTVRPQYRAKQKMLAKIYVELLAINGAAQQQRARFSLSARVLSCSFRSIRSIRSPLTAMLLRRACCSFAESSDDAQQLLNWKKPASGFQRNEQGNFPEVRARPPPAPRRHCSSPPLLLAAKPCAMPRRAPQYPAQRRLADALGRTHILFRASHSSSPSLALGRLSSP